jgi:hypothetical protein
MVRVVHARTTIYARKSPSQRELGIFGLDNKRNWIRSPQVSATAIIPPFDLIVYRKPKNEMLLQLDLL